MERKTYNPIEILRATDKLLEKEALTQEEQEALIDLTNYLIDNIDCAHCRLEKQKILSIGMLRNYCCLNEDITNRSFNDYFYNNSTNANYQCPLKKMRIIKKSNK